MRKYLLFTHYPSMLFCVRVAGNANSWSKQRFGQLWADWCAEPISKKQYEKARESQQFKIRNHTYKMAPDNKYVSNGETDWDMRVTVLEA